MYLLIEEDSALIIDPNQSEEAMSILRETSVKDLTILLTHEHFDHISGVNWYKNVFSTRIICHRDCAEYIADPDNNIPWTFFALMSPEAKGHEKEVEAFCKALPTDAVNSDVTFDDNYEFWWREHSLKLMSKPGHSPGSIIIEFNSKYIFTGDYMILDLPVLLTLPRGSKKAYKHTLSYLLSIDNNYEIMPGHGEPYSADGLKYKNGIFTKS